MLKRAEAPAAYVVGQYLARLGETEEALEWYERAAKGEEFENIFFAVDPVNFRILDEPRARTLARPPKDR